MPYQRKTHDEYRLFGFYEHGWEEVTAATSRRAIREHLKEYQKNEPVPFKWTGPHRVPNA